MAAAGNPAPGPPTTAAPTTATPTTATPTTATPTTGSQPPRVTAVVVTYNRRDLLAEALSAVLAQSRAPDAVIVIDNASADGTAEMVATRFPSVRLATARRNTGGAGGFAYGLALALAGAADLVWLMDDDTVPEPGALRAMLDARALHPGGPPALIASRVVWTDGRSHPMNTPRIKPLVSKEERAAAAAAGCLPIRSASFVSILVDAGLCRARGLPQADYFLWNDDFEFTARLLRGRRACSARPAWWCTRRPRSARQTPTPASGSSTRCGTRSGCCGPAPRWPQRNGCCTAAPRCAAGPGRSRSPPTGERSGPACAQGSRPACGPPRGPPGKCWRQRA